MKSRKTPVITFIIIVVIIFACFKISQHVTRAKSGPGKSLHELIERIGSTTHGNE